MKTWTYLGITGFLFLGTINSTFGQTKFALSINLAPIYTHTDYNSTLPFPDSNTQSPTTVVTSSSHGLNYMLGLSARYNFSPKWSASTGIWATHGLSGTTHFDINGISAQLPYRYSHPFTNAYKVPLLVNYESSTKRLSPYFSMGASLDFRSVSYVELEGNGQEVPVKFGKALIITPIIGVGAIYQLNNHLLIVAQPTIQYNVQSHPTYAYYHSYQIGLQMQLMHQF
ncbi:PorT family protein [Spirosoma endbachense]|uniref:Outer membrane beta-barrel protein n=1 Tax=Spirosoma endbachense TaxID=2666025 RepID=A0A6P1W651_9BACT|nr:PorT family protein [Spirosoma endbachense]QHV99410.1 hypothetical protein GJR95_32310 [Spirosoma endbachense]